RARQAQLHAWVLKRLVERFAPGEVRTLSDEARSKRFSMIREHASGFQQKTSRLRQELEPIFFPALPPDKATDQMEIKSEADLAQAVGRLFELGSMHEQTMYSSFSISAESATTSVIKTPQFWQSLRSAEKLAASLQSVK